MPDRGFIMTEILQAVSTVGFPIVAFFCSFYALKYSYDNSTKYMQDSLTKIGNLTEAVNNNTEILSDLLREVKNSR